MSLSTEEGKSRMQKITQNGKLRVEIGNREFILDRQKAEKAHARKSVINGRESMTFDLLPLKYQWAYDLYTKMKHNHWEPEDVPMGKDKEQWVSNKTTDIERWIIRMGIGYFSAAEGIVGDNIYHVIRAAVTSPELKLMLGRHVQEENVHADSLLYMISSLGINPHECEAMFTDVESIVAKNEFVVENSKALRNNLDLTKTNDKQALAKNMFLYGQCMEGTQFYGLFGMILSLARRNLFPGIGQMFRYTLRDESNHIEVFRKLMLELIKENPDIWTESFKADLVKTMKRAVELELDFIDDCLPMASIGLNADEFKEYIKYIANRRLKSCNLPEQYSVDGNPLPWLSEVMDLQKEQNFFEGRVTEYQRASALQECSDDEL